MCVRYYGEETFYNYNPAIKSPFSGRGKAKSLDCDLQKSFLDFLFLHLHETGRPKWGKSWFIALPLPPGQMRL